MKIKKLLAFGTIFLLSGAAHASLITFEFDGGPNRNVLLFSSGGVTLTATGESDFARARITNNRRGLGIRGARSGQINSNRNRFYEGINFSLSTPGTWVSAQLRNFRRGENGFICGSDAPFVDCNVESDIMGIGGNARQTISLASLAAEPVVLIGASQLAGRGRFRIASITVDVPMVGVPDPSLFGLASLGLVGLFATRRRRSL